MTKLKFRTSYTVDAHVFADSPRDCALAFFAKYPNKLRCEVMRVEVDEENRINVSSMIGAKTWKATRKTVDALPAQGEGTRNAEAEAAEIAAMDQEARENDAARNSKSEG